MDIWIQNTFWGKWFIVNLWNPGAEVCPLHLPLNAHISLREPLVLLSVVPHPGDCQVKKKKSINGSKGFKRPGWMLSWCELAQLNKPRQLLHSSRRRAPQLQTSRKVVHMLREKGYFKSGKYFLQYEKQTSVSFTSEKWHLDYNWENLVIKIQAFSSEDHTAGILLKKKKRKEKGSGASVSRGLVGVKALKMLWSE